MTRNAFTKQHRAHAPQTMRGRDLQALFDLPGAETVDATPVDLTIDGLGIAMDTHIATARGLVTVQSLSAGDRVVTRDNGMQRLRWVGRRSVTPLADDAPIRLAAGALGPDLPTDNLTLSPRHRVLVAGDAPRLSFDAAEVFVQARHLPQAQRVNGTTTHVQLMFDRHEVVLANGVWCESFHPSDAAIWALNDAQRDEIYAIFPDLAATGEAAFAPARRVLGRQEASILRG